MSSGYAKGEYEWNKPKKLPKKDKTIWIEREKKPVEAKVLKIIDGAKIAVTEIANPSNQWTIQHQTDNWADERPIEKYDSSGSFNGF